ncbi:acyl-protein synthetase [Aestuariibacter halophilus]|uniref:Acyl-protein synthetase n=1 Tax=Fluctibacter halophilus TaxID=226011 RepID=A0ABS8G3Q5_9ALTE|nr:acyl-protein synthetase [Aestuariibacter halophilus]MCC2615113.1 acyl-protein synthetase [Aestuariibacter halophilus]
MSLQAYTQAFEALLGLPVYDVPQAEKQAHLLPLLSALHQHHVTHCEAYARIAGDVAVPFTQQADVPYLAVRLFKHLALKSIADEDIFRVLRSSGTTGQQPAQIFLDRATSGRQSKVLVNILQHSIGKARLPMLIIDSPAIVGKDAAFSARAAGIQGLMFFGRDHTYALDENMQPDWSAIERFCDTYRDQPVLVFGFTFMVWQYWIRLLADRPCLDLKHGVLLHSGGWKKLHAERVSNADFKTVVQARTGIANVVNFYGMAEQVGSVFTECEQGHLHAPLYADVLVRDPYTLQTLPHGQPGLLQMLSVLPTSYPGHSILTEDMGRVLGEDDCPCGRKGRYISIEQRLPKTELRGCSDTHGGAV